MAAKIITPRQHCTETSYKLSYLYKHDTGAGFGFPCDENGKVNEADFAPAGLANYRECLAGTNGTFFDGVEEQVRNYTEPAVAQCETCSASVVLDNPLDNVCSCGACYNMSGQSVIPSWQCDDEGNPYHEDY